MIVILVKEGQGKLDTAKKIGEALRDLLDELVIEDYEIYATPIEEFEEEGE